MAGAAFAEVGGMILWPAHLVTFWEIVAAQNVVFLRCAAQLLHKEDVATATGQDKENQMQD